MRLTHFLAMLLMTGCRATSVYESPSIPSDSRCYQLAFTEWSPGVDPDDLAWFMPPKTVALTSLPAPHPREGDWFRVLPDRDPDMPSEKMVFAAWRIGEAGTTQIVWSNGFTGVRFVLRPVSEGLEGTAQTFSDAPGGVYRSVVQAKSVRCS
jgi:hypothetical protein